jgi:hypothetical protein
MLFDMLKKAKPAKAGDAKLPEAKKVMIAGLPVVILLKL